MHEALGFKVMVTLQYLDQCEGHSYAKAISALWQLANDHWDQCDLYCIFPE